MDFDPEAEWPALKSLAEAGAATTLVDRIAGFADGAARVSLYRLTIRKLAFEPWDNKDLDVMTAVADAALDDCDRLGGDYVQQAAAISYNTSANLADCWDDDFRREPRHFEKGIEYARRSLQYRKILEKGPRSLALATWALGKHQQSLGRQGEALGSFRRCLDLETAAATEEGRSAEVSVDAPDGYLIAVGYLALMENDQTCLRELAAVLKDHPDREDAEVIRSQLVATARQLGISFDSES